MSKTISELLAELHALCVENALNYQIRFAEGEGLFYIEADGLAEGEYFEIKTCSSIENGITYLLALIREA